MFKSFCAVLGLCFIVSFSYGQGVIKGRVYEYKTHVPLTDIPVQNINSKERTTSNDKGRFSISVKMGDMLVIGGFSYRPDTILITNMRELEVVLIPHTTTLDQVTIKDSITDTKNLSHYYDPQFHGQPLVYSRDANMNYKGGVTLRLSYWNKDAKKREKLENELKDQAVMDDINRTFTPANIGGYVPLKGQELKDFIALYTPDADTYKSSSFNLLVYLNGCYKQYLKLPVEKRRVEKLDSLKLSPEAGDFKK